MGIYPWKKPDIYSKAKTGFVGGEANLNVTGGIEIIGDTGDIVDVFK